MRRHSTDPVALLAGALFIVVGAAYLGGGLSDTKIEARWILPTVLITVGFAGLVASLVNLARQRRTAGLTAPPVDSGAAPAGPGANATATMPGEPETLEPMTDSPEAEPPQTPPLETPPSAETDDGPGDQPRDRA